ncbi:hypothetical protein ACFFGR_14570, partial [Arthrobacter liuii]
NATGAARSGKFNQSHNIIGINKLGTLLSSQTTDTFEYSRKQFINELLFRISSLRCFNLISSIFTFANPVVFPEFTWWDESAQQNGRQFLQIHAKRGKNCFSSVGGLSPLSGGDSKNNTRPPAAAQIGCRGACIKDPKVLRNQHLNSGQVLLAPAQEQVLAVQKF